MTKTSPLILCIGRAYIDVIAKISEETLTTLPYKKSHSYEVSQEEIKALIAKLEDPEYIPGGNAANTASGIGALGGNVRFIGKTARDSLGTLFKNAFLETHVSFTTAPANEENAINSCCVALNTLDKATTYAHNADIAHSFTDGDFKQEDFEKASIIFVRGSILCIPNIYKQLLPFLQHAKNNGAKIASTLQYLNQEFAAPDVTNITDIVDILIGNENEVPAFLSLCTIEQSDKFDMIVTTIGEKGVIIEQGENKINFPAHPVAHIEDTIGAGDLFVAGFLSALSENISVKKAVDLGTKCAALIIQQHGARPHPKTISSLQSLGELYLPSLKKTDKKAQHAN